MNLWVLIIYVFFFKLVILSFLNKFFIRKIGKRNGHFIMDVIVAVVVTYNRKDLLQECLKAILDQTITLNHIIIIDNASTDGTTKFLEENGYLSNPLIDYVLMETNTGGSGGFYEGIQKAMTYFCDWIWLMDDDTVPQFDCLEKLIKAKNTIESAETQKGLEKASKPSFLSSSVYGKEGEFMNLPVVSRKTSMNGYEYWYRFLKYGIVDVDSSTFVSVLIRTDAAKICGLPCKEFFIWGDDSEYTRRLSTYYGDGYFVGDSIAIHKRANAKELRIDNETNPNRIKMFHYFYRNKLINRHFYHDNYRGAFLEMLKAVYEALKYLRKPYGFLKARTVIRGSWEGIIQYNKFASFIKNEMNT